MRFNEITKQDFVKGLKDPVEADFRKRFAQLQSEASEEWTLKLRRKKSRGYFLIIAEPSDNLKIQLDDEDTYSDIGEVKLFAMIDLVAKAFPRDQYKHGQFNPHDDYLQVFKIYEAQQ